MPQTAYREDARQAAESELRENRGDLEFLASCSAQLGDRIAMYTTYIASRTQIYLHEHQERRLKERSRQLGRTKSALIREAIDAYLSPSDGEEEALMRLHAAVEEARGAAPDLPSGADYVEELRAAEAGRQRAHDRRG